MTLAAPVPIRSAAGFTLTEIAIVMFIVALMLGGMLMPLSAQQDVRARQETDKVLADAKEALIGFAVTNDRMPCPASGASGGVESFCVNTTDPYPCTATLVVQSHGRCSNPHDGFLPAATLGFTPINSQRYAVDGWGVIDASRVRYAVTDFSSGSLYPFTYASGLKTVFSASKNADLEVCATGAQVRIPPQITAPDTATMFCHPSFRLASDAVAVVYSLGKNGGVGGSSDDEKHNPNPLGLSPPDRAFVAAEPGPAFDDQLVWISRNTLFARLIAAGRLP